MKTLNHVRKWQVMGCLLFVASISLLAQEGNRTTIDMTVSSSGCTIRSEKYFDLDVTGQTYDNSLQKTVYTWGWAESLPSGEPRVKFITDKTQNDPHAGFAAVLPNHNATVRLASTLYQDDAYSFQTAQGASAYYQFTVSANNAIAVFDYATMLEYPVSHGNTIQTAGNAWKYHQPWVQFYVVVLDGNGTENIQEPTRVIHAYAAPNGLSGWQQCATASGWRQVDNVPLYDASTQSYVRNMTLLVKDWSSVGLDLRACIGYTVRIYAEYYDCAFSNFNGEADLENQNFCFDHHMARIYSSLACTQALLQKEDETCDPATVTYSAPEGFSYRWYTASNPNATLSTAQTCKYTFASGNEQTELVCEIKSPTNMTATTLSVPLQNKCACHATFNFPEYVCADANTLDIDYEYTSGSAKSFDVTFNDEALMRGFNNLTNQPVSLGNRISIPMPAANGTQYVRPNQYMMTLRVHQSSGMDTVMTKTFEVRYPSWLIQQRWNDVLALYNSNYNGGYYFSAVQWYQAGMPVATGSPSETYIYRPEGLNTETDYWVALTRADDGKTFCSCPLRPVVKNFAPERKKAPIDLSASDNNRMRVRVTTDRSGQYIVYSPAGQALLKGYFGTAYGSPDITLPGQGTFVLRFVADDGTEETLKWIAY